MTGQKEVTSQSYVHKGNGDSLLKENDLADIMDKTVQVMQSNIVPRNYYDEEIKQLDNTTSYTINQEHGTREHSTTEEHTAVDSKKNNVTDLVSLLNDEVSKDSDVIDIDNTSDTDKMFMFVPTTEYNNKKYHDGYIVKLQKTCDGFMIGFTIGFKEKLLLEDYYLAFLKYIRYLNNKMSHGEEWKVIHNEDDILVAIDNEDLSGKCITDVLQLFDWEAFNAHDYKRVCSGNVERENEY